MNPSLILNEEEIILYQMFSCFSFISAKWEIFLEDLKLDWEQNALEEAFKCELNLEKRLWWRAAGHLQIFSGEHPTVCLNHKIRFITFIAAMAGFTFVWLKCDGQEAKFCVFLKMLRFYRINLLPHISSKISRNILSDIFGTHSLPEVFKAVPVSQKVSLINKSVGFETCLIAGLSFLY